MASNYELRREFYSTFSAKKMENIGKPSLPVNMVVKAILKRRNGEMFTGKASQIGSPSLLFSFW
jgi:hypothetical protein